MDVHVEVVGRAGDLRALLEENGWGLKEGVPNHFTATHPDVSDQPMARSRLHKIGLLTSGRLRIEFGPSAN
jgi:hypothetical protein